MELNLVESGEGPPLVLLHGFTGDVSSWDEWLPQLETTHRVFRCDLPGHGGSSIEEAEVFFLPDLAVAIRDELEKRAVICADWIGYSMGGRALLHLAEKFPTLVRSMVVLSASPGIADSGERALRTAKDAALADRIEAFGLETFVSEWMAQPLFASLANASPARVAGERARKLDGTATGYAAALRAMSPGQQPSLWKRLPSLTMPALLVVGALDLKYVRIAEKMATAMPAGRVEVLPAVGHALLLEAPERAAELIQGFFLAESIW